MENVPATTESLRARKRRETLQRIAETGLRLFIENGYEATTLDAIAAAAGISRRTFFYYFRSKEDVLLAWQGSGFQQALRPVMLKESPEQAPLQAVQSCLFKLVSRYETEQSVLVDSLLKSTEALRARKQAINVEMEQTLLAAMSELWPGPERRDTLRMIAMISMGTLRIAMEDWRRDEAKHSLADHLRRGFAVLDATVFHP